MDSHPMYRDNGVKGGGLWSHQLNEKRIGNIERWLSKAPPAYSNMEPQRMALSRHTNGIDMHKPSQWSGRGRRETDVWLIGSAASAERPMNHSLAPLSGIVLTIEPSL